MKLSSLKLKKLLMFQEGTLQARKIKRIKKIYPQKISYIFSKNFFSYISGKWNSCISGNRTF